MILPVDTLELRRKSGSEARSERSSRVMKPRRPESSATHTRRACTDVTRTCAPPHPRPRPTHTRTGQYARVEGTVRTVY
eukprot:6423977-Pyramimonas_sp.AAC.1